jgi:myosin-crossreactive antigen
VGTLEYSVHAAQIAVFGTMEADKKLKDIRKFEHNFKALTHAVKNLLA